MIVRLPRTIALHHVDAGAATSAPTSAGPDGGVR